MNRELGVDFDWRPFYLHPEIPPGGVRVAELFGPERAAAFDRRLRAFAAEFGVPIRPPERAPNTLPALAMTEYARAAGALDGVRDALMRAHWVEGADIEADDVLAAAAEAAGLDPGEAVAAARDPAWIDRVRRARAEAIERGVTAIPTYWIGGAPLVGCQPFDVVARALRKRGVAA